MDEIGRLYGQSYDSATAVGMQVKKLAPKLLEQEGVSYEYKLVGKLRARTHIFTRERI